MQYYNTIIIIIVLTNLTTVDVFIFFNSRHPPSLDNGMYDNRPLYCDNNGYSVKIRIYQSSCTQKEKVRFAISENDVWICRVLNIRTNEYYTV